MTLSQEVVHLNYVTEINAFWDWRESNPKLSPSAIALWFALMSTANKAGWPKDFSVAISLLQSKIGAGKDAVYTARNQLQQKGRIEFRERKGNQSAVYHLISFASEYPTQTPTQAPVASEYPTQIPTQTPTQCPTQTPNINKLNKTKQIRKKDANASKEKFTPPSLVEVTAYCAERANGIDPEQWQDFYTSNGWMVGKSRMKDWKASVRTWERRGSQNSPKQNKSAQTAGSSIDKDALDAYISGQFVDGGECI